MMERRRARERKDRWTDTIKESQEKNLLSIGFDKLAYRICGGNRPNSTGEEEKEGED